MKRTVLFAIVIGAVLCVPACDKTQQDGTNNDDAAASAKAPENSVDYSNAAPGKVTTLETEEAYRNFINDNEIAVVKFGAEWCPPCHKLDPEFDKIAGHFQSSGIAFARVDVDELKSVARSLDVGAIPDTRIFYKGQSYNYVVGNEPVSIANALESMRQETKPTAEVAAAVKNPNAPLEEELWKDEEKEEAPKKDLKHAEGAKHVANASHKIVKVDVEAVLNETEPAEVKTVTKLDELKTYFQNNDLVVVKLGATWCPPCRKLEPKLPLLAGRFKEAGVTFIDVDVDESEEISVEYKVSAIPDVIVFYKGVEKGRVVGYRLEEIYSLVEYVSVDPDSFVYEEFKAAYEEAYEETSVETTEETAEETEVNVDENEEDVEFEQNEESVDENADDDGTDDGTDEDVDFDENADDDGTDDGDDGTDDGDDGTDDGDDGTDDGDDGTDDGDDGTDDGDDGTDDGDDGTDDGDDGTDDDGDDGDDGTDDGDDGGDDGDA